MPLHLSSMAAIAAAVLVHTAPVAAATTNVTPILSAAQAMPAEFQADALLLVVTRQKSEQGTAWPLNRADTVATLEKVYALGFNAAAKFPTRPVASASEDAVTRWTAAPLDRVSLQMAAAERMVALDPARAMAMFARDEKLKAVVAQCGASELEDYSKIYTVAAKLLQSQATPDAKFVEERLDRVHSATALAPVLRLAVDDRFDTTQFSNIARWASDALHRVTGDDQAFFATLHEVDAAVGGLRAVLAEKGVSDTALKQAYAAYLTQNLNGPRCSENAHGLPLQTQDAVVEGNRADLGLSVAAAALPPDRSDEPESVADRLGTLAANVVIALQGDENGAGKLSGTLLSNLINGLLNAVDAAASLPEDAQSSVYKARVATLLEFLDYAPVGAQQTRAKNTVLALVVGSPLYRTDRVDWFVGVKQLLRSIDGWSDRNVQLQVLAASANPVLRTYALLTKEGMLDEADPIGPANFSYGWVEPSTP